MVWALLPVKDLVRAKSRLAGVLAPHERRALAQAMVEDVLSVLVASSGLEGILLVSDDPGADLLAHKYKLEAISESSLDCRGLNSVIAGASELLQARGVESVMVVHSDIPLLQAADVDLLLSRFRDPDVDLLVSPDLAGQGTNIMLFECGSLPHFHYGVGSCPAHLAEARAAGLQAELLALDTVGLDIDEPSDLLNLHQRLLAGERGTHCAALLLEPPLQQRLSLLAGSDNQPGDSQFPGSAL